MEAHTGTTKKQMKTVFKQTYCSSEFAIAKTVPLEDATKLIMEMMAKVNEPCTEEEVSTLVAQFDTDSDGSIHKKELKTALMIVADLEDALDQEDLVKMKLKSKKANKTKAVLTPEEKETRNALKPLFKDVFEVSFAQFNTGGAKQLDAAAAEGFLTDLWGKSTQEVTEGTVGELIAQMDVDNDGFLKKKELKAAIKHLTGFDVIDFETWGLKKEKNKLNAGKKAERKARKLARRQAKTQTE